MLEIAESLLTLFIVCFGFYCVGYAVRIFKKHPAKVLGEMIRATIKGTFVLLKALIEAIGQLIMALVHGAPVDKEIGNGDHGKTAFLTGFDRFKLLNGWKKDGLVLDGKRAISLQNAFRHIAVFAPTGGGKTSSVILPAVLNLKPDKSVFINDPSGEIHTKASGHLLQQGFSVRVINVSDIEHSLSFNPLFRADSHTAISQVADTLIHHALADNRSDPFWKLKAQGLLATLIRCLKQEEPEYCTLHNLRFLLNSFGQDGRPLNSWIAKHAPDEATFHEWKGFISQSPKVMQSIISTASAALEKVADTSIARLTATETLHFEDLRKKPTAIFVIVPEHQTRYWAFLTDLLLMQVFSFCMEPKRPGEPYFPVFFLLDEFGHARIPGFSTATVTMRKRECSICILLQEPAMLEQTYGKADAATILGGGVVSKIFMPGLSLETCERLSRTIGKGDDNRPALSPSQIRTLPDRTALLVHGNKKPVVLNMTPYYENPKLLKRTSIPPAPLPESTTSTELQWISLGGKPKEEENQPEVKATYPKPDTENKESVSRAPVEAAKRPETLSPLAEALPHPEQHPTPLQHANKQPPWADELLQESRRAREEVEILRESIGVHVVTRAEAAQILNVSKKTLYRYEKAGRVERVTVSAPGVHYSRESVLKLKQERS